MTKKLKKRFNADKIRKTATFELQNKYFNVFLNKFEIQGIDDSWAKEYTLRNLFNGGTIATFNFNGFPVQCQYVVNSYGLNWRPATANVVNECNVPGFPIKPLQVDKDIVIGYLQHSHKGMVSTINYYIDRMVQVLMSILVNLETSKLPFLIGIDDDNISAIEDIIDRIYANELAVFCPMDVASKLQVANTGSQYLVDQLWTQYLNFECDLLTAMGIDCNSLNMNKITVDQANANNTLINNINDGFNDCLKDYCDKCNELFGTNYSITIRQPEILSIHQDEEYEEVEEDGIRD